MALYGFALNYTDGTTDYCIVAAPDLVTAEIELADTLDYDNMETVVHYDAETIVQEQYRGVAILSTEYHVPDM